MLFYVCLIVWLQQQKAIITDAKSTVRRLTELNTV